jgi:hypothetical protein
MKGVSRVDDRFRIALDDETPWNTSIVGVRR